MLRYEFPISVVNMKSIQEMLVFLTLLEPLLQRINIDPDRISFIQNYLIRDWVKKWELEFVKTRDMKMK